MRRMAMVAVLALAACGQDPESTLPDPGALYRIEGADLYCDGAEVWNTVPDAPPFTQMTCAWECVTVDGRDVRRVDLTFRRDAPAAPWSLDFAGWTFGSCG